MKNKVLTVCSTVVLATLISASATAHASDIILDSNSSTVVYGGSSGTDGTPISFGSSTFNLGTGGGVWADPVGTSSWVSFNPNNAPGGYIAPNGTYYYSSSFTASADDFGSIWILADDTASIYLNGNLIEAPTDISPVAHCIAGDPNCENAAEFALPLGDFVNGTNVLTFDVQQLYGGATGLDFEADIDPPAVPEPNSLLLLGTGLVGVAGMLRRRIFA